MIFFKRIDKPYMEPECVKNVIDYIFRNNGNVNTYIGGLNIIEPINAAEEFNMVKSYYGKTAGTQLRHYIVSLEPKDHCIPYMAAELAYLICAYYGDRYQSVFSVHSNTNYLHVHIIVNSVSFVDGKKLHECIYRSDCHACTELLPTVAADCPRALPGKNSRTRNAPVPPDNRNAAAHNRSMRACP